MMRMRTVVALSVGLAIGYVAGTAAGRPAFERMQSKAEELATEMGLAEAAARIRERGQGVAQATVDLAAAATRDAVDTAATKVEQLSDAQSRLHNPTDPSDDPSV